MKRTKVVQVASGGFVTPYWVSEVLDRAGIDFSFAECYDASDLAQHAGDADIVWITGGRTLLTGANLKSLDRCGGIVVTSTGTDNVDSETATALGIIVAHTPQTTTDPVADQAIALLFSLVRQVVRHDSLVRQGKWDPMSIPLRRFANSTLGLVGFGRIAQRVVQKLAGFDMDFVTHTRSPRASVLESYGVTSASLDELLQISDYVSLHCPLTSETYHMIGERELQLMKQDAVLINTARGAVVDEVALTRALRDGWIAGAGLDVMEREPPDPSNPLLTLGNVVLTPHVAGNSDRLPQDEFEASVEAIRDLTARRYPQHIVNPEVRPRWGQLDPAIGASQPAGANVTKRKSDQSQ